MKKMTKLVTRVAKHTSKDYLDLIKAINKSRMFKKKVRLCKRCNMEVEKKCICGIA